MTYGTPITINNPSPAAQDYFGVSVSIDGDKFIVGAFFDDTGATDAGSAYLYDATTGALLHTFNNPTPASGDAFGTSVSVLGEKVLIGAYRENIGATVAGAAYLFDATTGALLQTLSSPTPENYDNFGNLLSISDDNILISAIGDDTGATDAGSAYLFDARTGALLHTFNTLHRRRMIASATPYPYLATRC